MPPYSLATAMLPLNSFAKRIRVLPGDPRFPVLHLKHLKLCQRVQQCETALGHAKKELEDDHFVAALGKYREALSLSRGLDKLENKAVNAALAEAEEILPRNWRISESLLLEIGQLNSRYAVPNSLWEDVHSRQREETVSNALAEADRAQAKGEIKPVRDHLAMLSTHYPDEERIKARLAILDTILLAESPTKVIATPPPVVAAPVVAPPPLTLESDPAPEPAVLSYSYAQTKAAIPKIAMTREAWAYFKTGLAATAALLIVTIEFLTR